MIISGSKVFKNQYVSYILDASFQVRTTGIYFTLGKIYSFEGSGVIDFDRSFQQLPHRKELLFNPDFSIELAQGTYYIEFNEKVSIPGDIMGIFLQRKDIIKTGISVTAAMLNPFYKGTVGALLRVENPKGVKLIKHARLGQWIFLKLGSRNLDTSS